MINGKQTTQILADHLKDDATIMKDFGVICGFIGTITLAPTATPAVILAGVLVAAGAAISAGARIRERFARDDSEQVAKLPHTYDRFKVLFYTQCQISYFEALRASAGFEEAIAAQGGDLDLDIERLKNHFITYAAQLTEAEVRFHYSIDPTQGSIPLYSQYTHWLTATLYTLLPHSHLTNSEAGYGHRPAAPVIAHEVEKDARVRLRVALAQDDPASNWMRNYLAIDLQTDTLNKVVDIESKLDVLQGTLSEWTKPGLADNDRRKTLWDDYRSVLRGLPNQKESMYNENFGVSEVFILPQVAYRRTGASGQTEQTETPPHVGTLLAALVSTRVPGDDLVFICGGPGSGKSTLCRMLAAELAKRDELHPVFLKLRRCKEGEDISQFIEDSLRREGVINRLSDLRCIPNLTLILDGFDEIVLASQSRLRHLFTVLVDDLRTGSLRNARVVVSGRDTLFREGKGLPRGSHIVQVLPFNPQQVAAWSKKWRTLHLSGAGGNFSPEILLRQSEGTGNALAELATWPLTLHLLARLHTSGLFSMSGDSRESATTVEKAYLYRGILHETASRQLEQVSGQGRLEPERMRKFLRGVALEMYQRSIDSMAVQDVIPIAHMFFSDVSDDVAMSELAEIAIVNSPEIQKGEDTGFEFVHKSFAEFLAAESLGQIIEEVCHRVPDIAGVQVWHRNEREAAALWARHFSVRVLSPEVQEMMEPILGVFVDFSRRTMVSDTVETDVVTKGLYRVLDRCSEMYQLYTSHDASMFESLYTGEKSSQHRASADPLLRLACFGVNIIILGTAAAQRLCLLGEDVSFDFEPHDGAFWSWIMQVHAGGIHIHGDFAKRVYAGGSFGKETGVRDSDFPIEIGLLAEIPGYQSENRSALNKFLTDTEDVLSRLIVLVQLISSSPSPSRKEEGRRKIRRGRRDISHFCDHVAKRVEDMWGELEDTLSHTGAWCESKDMMAHRMTLRKNMDSTLYDLSEEHSPKQIQQMIRRISSSYCGLESRPGWSPFDDIRSPKMDRNLRRLREIVEEDE